MYNKQIKLLYFKQWAQIQLDIIQQMHGPLVMSSSKSKAPKSSAKSRIRSAALQIQQLYQRHDVNHSHAIYARSIELTFSIATSLAECKKELLDFRDILSNNLTLGMRMKYDAMIAGYSYVTTRYLLEGITSVGYYLNVIRSLAESKAKQVQNQGPLLRSEMMLAYENIKQSLLISPNSPKTEVLLQKISTGLSRLFETDHVRGQDFYHCMLRQCKAGNRCKLYKQLLASYFKHLQNFKMKPKLDICKLLYDSLTFPQSQNSEVDGFLIRRCYFMINDNWNSAGFYVDDHCLYLTTQKSLEVCEHCSKTVFTICQVLFKIERTQILVNLSCDVSSNNADKTQTTGRPHWKNSNPSSVEVCEYIAEIYLILRQEPTAIHKLETIRQNLRFQMSHLMQQSQMLIYLWDQVINNLQQRKSKLISLCHRQKILQNRQNILEQLIFVDLQHIILTNPQHIRASNNHYLQYAISNAYFLLVGAMISQHLSMSLPEKKNVQQLCAKLETSPSIAYKYWDELFALANLHCSLQSLSLQSLSIVKSLLKCKRLLCYALSEKSVKMSGLMSLLLLLQSSKGREKEFLPVFLVLIKQVDELLLSIKVEHRADNYEKVIGYFLTLSAEYQNYLTIQQMQTVSGLKGKIMRQSELQSRNTYRCIFHKYLATKLREGLSEEKFHAYFRNYMRMYEGNRSPQESAYERILFIDFMQWTIHYCTRMGLLELSYQSTDLLAEFTSQTPLIDYLKGINKSTDSFQVSLECFNKLIYLINHQKQQKPMENFQFNLQFELEEASIRICKIIELFDAFLPAILAAARSRLAYSSIEVEDIVLGKSDGTWHQWINNIERVLVCMSNVIGVGHYVGYSRHIDDFVKVRLMLAAALGRDRLFYELSVMKFMGYLVLSKKVTHEIHKYSKLEGEAKQIKLLMRALMGWAEQSQQMGKFQKVVYLLNTIKHMHPHKGIIRSMSGRIWEISNISENAVLAYNQSLLPSANMVFFTSANHSKDISIDNNQMCHSMLAQTLSRLLTCILAHDQRSQFRSILRLALIYFIRARNVKGILLALQCSLSKNPQQLNLLHISDSLKMILSSLYPTCFNSKQYSKFCEIFLKTSTSQHRKSASFLLSCESVSNMLAKSVQNCGQIGLSIYWFFGQHAAKILKFRLHQMYIPYLKMKCEDLSIKLSQNQQAVLQMVEQMPTYSTQRSQCAAMELMRSVISSSFEHAKIVESFLSEILQKSEGNIHDLIVLQVSILMLDHNYKYKKMIESMPQLDCNMDSYSFVSSIRKANEIYTHFLDRYVDEHVQVMDFMRSSRMKYPMNILYPIGSQVYNITLQRPLLIVPIDRCEFQDSIATVDGLIANNSKILNDKTIQPKQWWKSRDRVNRSIGKLANELCIGLWDTCLPIKQLEALTAIPNVNEESIKSLKIAYSLKKQPQKQVSKIKSYLQQREVIKEGMQFEEMQMIMNKFSQQCHTMKNEVNDENLLLLTHEAYVLFPFQANQQLVYDRAVYRLPSASYLYHQYLSQSSCKLIKANRLSYLVNSGDDLPDTQKNFYKIKEDFPQWTGIVGRKPELEEYFNLLKSQGFLFMGHGAGSAHLRERSFYSQSINCLMMLFGCSSVALTQSKCESHGISYSHLINGCPSLLGCLWEVTDKDTDKLTQKMFKTVNHCPQNLSKILAMSRRRCRHEYLNGGALVIFGIPTYMYCE